MIESNLQIFSDVIILLFAAVFVAAVFQRIRIPSILGYLVVGVLLGPHLIGWVSDHEEVRNLAEFGVVFLLFTIGLEFSLSKLLAMRNTFLGYGVLQVVLSITVTAVIGVLLGMTVKGAIVVGGVVAMSSTAIVMKQLSESLQLNTPPGKNAVGILLLQDVAVIPFLMLIPTLALTQEYSVAMVTIMALIRGLAAIIFILLLGRLVLRPLFRQIAITQSSELFTLATLLVVLSAAWLTHYLGLSLALGAFLAGMMLGETEYRHQIEIEIRPFRDALLGLFFITIGMQLNLHSLLDTWVWVFTLLAALVLFKTLLVMVLGLLFGNDLSVSLRSGLILAQGGEFGFAILLVALNYQLFPADYGQVILSALVLSMAISPMVITHNRGIASVLLPSATRKRHQAIMKEIEQQSKQIKNQAIICGYGRVGQHVCKLLDQESLPYIALDFDARRVSDARLAGYKVNYGDATRDLILRAAGIDHAKALVVCIDDRNATIRIAAAARKLNNEIPIIVRVYNEEDYDDLQEIGITDVIPDTLELSLILGSRLLILMGVSAVKVFQLEEYIRRSSYQMLREVFPGFLKVGKEDSDMPQLTAVVITENAYAVNQSLGNLELTKQSVEVIGIRRNNISMATVSDELVIQANDVIVLFGRPRDLARAENRLLEGQ